MIAMAAVDLTVPDVHELHERYFETLDEQIGFQLVRHHERLALSLANRFRGRGESIEDLEQVARMGILLALRRFDPRRGARFSTFATPTILGELRRHFRDRGWLVRPPRSLQELYLAAHRASDELESQLARTPAASEVAEAIGAAVEEVAAGVAVGECRRAAVSLDASPRAEDLALHEALGAEDPRFAGADDRLAVAALLRALPEVDRAVLALTYLEALSQREIAERLGLSPMRVSRIKDRALRRLRALGAHESATA